MPFCYEFECPECGTVREETRLLEDRNKPGWCADCEVLTSKIISLVSFNRVFAGSERAETQADKAVREADIAQQEGFRSMGEIQEAEGLAAERAKQLGIPTNRILGSMPSPYEGKRYTADKGEVQAYEGLVKNHVEAHRTGNAEKAKVVKGEIKEFEKVVLKKAELQKEKMKFKPQRNKATCQKDIINSQRERHGTAI